MSAPSTSLACLEIRSIARGYQVLNLLSENSGLEILEASPVDAQRFLILVEGEQAKLAKAVDEVTRRAQSHFLDYEFLPSPQPALKQAIYSLQQVEIGDSLLVVETDTASRILSCAQLLMNENNLQLVEIKVGRGLRGQGLGFFTGKNSDALNGKAAVEALLKGMNRNGIAEVISEPTAKFKSYFNLAGN
jgi:hypothetical protein